MLMTGEKVGSDWNRHVAASLLRKWATLRVSEEQPLPALVDLAGKLGATSLLAVSLGSTFRLSEACLGRPLNLEGCCTPDLGEDASALIHMLNGVQADGAPLALRDAPPGLFSALASAVASARWLFSER